MAERRRRRRRPRRGALWLLLASVVLVGLLFAFVYPTQTFLDQRDATRRARAQLELLRSENGKLADEAQRLQQPAEIEKRARDYGMVRPGEQAYVIVPAPTLAPAPAADGIVVAEPARE
jgi:cell division protein FtsB